LADELTRAQKIDTIKALLEERKGYAQKGQTDKVALVDAELHRIGWRGMKPRDRAPDRLAGKQAATR
jgi:hypothetical protein